MTAGGSSIPEVRRLLADVPFTQEQRRHVEGLLDAWTEERT